MAEAFKCDVCGRFVEGSRRRYSVTVSVSKPSLDVCSSACLLAFGQKEAEAEAVWRARIDAQAFYVLDDATHGEAQG